MPVTIICPNCDARLTAPDTVLGKKVKCKKCDEPFVAKRAAADDDDDERPAKPATKSRREDDEGSPPRTASKARRPADDGDAGDEDEPRPKAKKKGKKKKQGSPGVLVALVVIGAVVLIGGGLGVYFGFIKEDKSTESTAGSDGTKGPPAPKGPPGGPVAGGGAWVEHVDAEGKYRISFPGRPTAQSQTVNADGQQRTVKFTQFQAGTEVFVAGSEPIPAGEEGDPERLLDKAEQDSGTQMKGATVTSKQPVTHAGVNGRELGLTIQSPAGPVPALVRLFVSNGRVYTVAVVGPTVQPSSPNVVKYFESLKFE